MKNKKIIILLLIISICVIGGTFAYFYNSYVLENEFKTKKYETTAYETFVSPDDWEPGDVTEKRVYVTNDSDVDMAVRISYTEEWNASDGTTLSNTQNGENLAIINLTNKKDWIKVGNYYYYKYRLAKDETTSTFMDSVKFFENISFASDCQTVGDVSSCTYTIGDYEDATYTLTVKIETIQFDQYESAWNPGIDLLDEKPLTGAETLVKNSNPATVTDYIDGDIHEMFAFSHDATAQTDALTDYRYIGNDPYNYVYFNCDSLDDQNTNTCEVWRIIGVFDVERPNPYDSSKTITEKRIKIVRGNDFSSEMFWNLTDNNDWSISSIKNFLNTDYYDKIGDASSYGLKPSAQSMIDTAKYYLGGNLNVYGSAEQFYGFERGNTVCGACNSDNTKLTWTGKVGLMYPSDAYMVYGDGVDDDCYNTTYTCETNASNSWIFNSNTVSGNSSSDTWLMNSGTGGSEYAFLVNNVGQLYAKKVQSYQLGIRPVVYLSKDVFIDSGTGRQNDPYKLGKELNAAEYLIKNATNDPDAVYSNETKDKMFVFEHAQTDKTSALTDYRYIGDDPKNYVNFNCSSDGTSCETWRIIGIFNVDDGNGNIEQRLKLVRGSELSDKMAWDTNNYNNWDISSISTFLNDDFYYRTGDASNYGLKASARSMIGNVKYYLGGIYHNSTTNYGSTEDMYGWERGTLVYSGRPTEWGGQVGLMYPSDNYMLYGHGVDNTCYNNPALCDDRNAPLKGWIRASNMRDNQSVVERYTAFISPRSDLQNNVFYVTYSGTIESYNFTSNEPVGIRPVVYLTKDVTIASGDGSSGDPYVFN